MFHTSEQCSNETGIKKKSPTTLVKVKVKLSLCFS